MDSHHTEARAVPARQSAAGGLVCPRGHRSIASPQRARGSCGQDVNGGSRSREHVSNTVRALKRSRKFQTQFQKQLQS